MIELDEADFTLMFFSEGMGLSTFGTESINSMGYKISKDSIIKFEGIIYKVTICLSYSMIIEPI